MSDISSISFPALPKKHYFSIGEVSELCKVKPHVLRYWEAEFDQLQPLKRKGNRRYYKEKEVVLIRKIRNLLYVEGYTISGAKLRLSSENKRNNKVISKPDNPKIFSKSDIDSCKFDDRSLVITPVVRQQLLEVLNILQGSGTKDDDL